MDNYFQLKPIKAAKISEISEATAASPLAEAERINFHIGHPVQDQQLLQRYFELVTGLNLTAKQIEAELRDDDLDHSSWTVEQQPILKFIYDTIRKSSSYMPRGGYVSSQPGELIPFLQDYLTQKQQDPLDYDSGQISGQKEIMIGSGGRWEMLRILFHVLDHFLVHQPATVASMGITIPGYLQQFNHLQFRDLGMDENRAMAMLTDLINRNSLKPLFLILGKITTESTRRQLRWIGLNDPVFFVEVNNAPNHLSLAREAKMANRVLRILTPAVFSPFLSELSINFVLGTYDFIKVLETIHFELKGTPASSEAALLIYLLKSRREELKVHERKIPDLSETVKAHPPVVNSMFQYARRFTERSEQYVASIMQILSNTAAKYSASQGLIEHNLQNFQLLPFDAVDEMSALEAAEIITQFLQNTNDPGWGRRLEKNFLAAFIKHHPEYKQRFCLAISGSARTALSLLGFHCGISEVVTTDLSWTYEHCFPKVTTVPLSVDLELVPEAMISMIQSRIEERADWKDTAAVIINNPHNASGKIFSEASIRQMLIWLLTQNIRVIDDLSYQNVAPQCSLDPVKTLRQIVNELIRDGYLSESESRNLISVHSLSKTDSFAGARLAVVEITDGQLLEQFEAMVSTIIPNHMALLLAYLFYRNYTEPLNQYWYLRNALFDERMKAIENACRDLPEERNPFGIEIHRPAGSMYPHMIIHRLPPGLSLDWLASGLANQGIGLIPLSTFARTAEGFELARKTYRLTLGGTAGPEKLYQQTRRVLIDLNRLIAQESSKYNKQMIGQVGWKKSRGRDYFSTALQQWTQVMEETAKKAKPALRVRLQDLRLNLNSEELLSQFADEFLPGRLQVLQQRIDDKINYALSLLELNTKELLQRLEPILRKEFYKEDLEKRKEKFRKRLFDRTVHPTQMFSLQVDSIMHQVLERLLFGERIPAQITEKLAKALTDEFLGYNIAISSADEAEELLIDLRMCIETEEYIGWSRGLETETFLSFWGDWDGSTRPSGQGHRLVAAVVMENVSEMAELLLNIQRHCKKATLAPELGEEIAQLSNRKRRFWNLLNEITRLTNQLEKRYRTVLPYSMPSSSLRRLAMRMHLARDPLLVLWQHNDHLERKMLELRKKRREGLEYYFLLNKKLRKALFENIPFILENLDKPELLLKVGFFRDRLQRFVLTPRIHQKLITSEDTFAIDTTVFNITEINEIAGTYGNPGMILGLQVSMSTDAEALIVLDRKLRAQKEHSLRDHPQALIAPVWSIPLFEDENALENIENYLDKLWAYTIRSRRIQQQIGERFSEMICELFIAGSDLSQQVSQPAGAALYSHSKFKIIRWLAEHGLVETTRLKLGSGEPMQRQGGYYSPISGQPAFLCSKKARERLGKEVKAASQKSTEYARSPLMGILSSGDLRTLQSNIFERLRSLGVEERAEIFEHLHLLQRYHDGELIRASEPLLNTRLQFKERGLAELRRLTEGTSDPFYEEFLKQLSNNFRQILYGREEDVIGLHVISYFISRCLPALRDRPSVRPSREIGEQQAGQRVIERIAQTLPLARHGSLLRAIDNNRAQSMILGVNQLSSGLFRALSEVMRSKTLHGATLSAIGERLLPRLPVYEILHSLRLYHDPGLKYLAGMERLFPAGNSAFLAVREDTDAAAALSGFFQKELLRRHGLDINDFFDEDRFNPNLLPTLRPDLAVLLQEDIFNTSPENFLKNVKGTIDPQWQKQVINLLHLPQKIQYWRDKAWQLIHLPIQQQVESFVKLAMAINTLTAGKGQQELPFAGQSVNISRLGKTVKEALRGVVDDSMRQFLQAAVQYLTQLPNMTADVPIDIIRALKDVQKIVQMESQALSSREQDLLRFYILQMARIAGENG